MSRSPYRPFGRDRNDAAGPRPSPPAPVAPAGGARNVVPDTRVLGQLSALRAERVYDEAQTCPDCAAARQQSGRDDALCDPHLGDALGLNAQWGLQGPAKKF